MEWQSDKSLGTHGILPLVSAQPVGELSERLTSIDRRLDSFEIRVDHRFDTIDGRFSTIDQRFDSLQWRMTSLILGSWVTLLAAILGTSFIRH